MLENIFISAAYATGAIMLICISAVFIKSTMVQLKKLDKEEKEDDMD